MIHRKIFVIGFFSRVVLQVFFPATTTPSRAELGAHKRSQKEMIYDK